MPNPKTGTVTFDVAKALQEIKAGKVEFRVDKTSIIHVPVGKISFAADQLADNASAIITRGAQGEAARGEGQVRPHHLHLFDDEPVDPDRHGRGRGEGGVGRDT